MMRLTPGTARATATESLVLGFGPATAPVAHNPINKHSVRFIVRVWLHRPEHHHAAIDGVFCAMANCVFMRIPPLYGRRQVYPSHISPPHARCYTCYNRHGVPGVTGPPIAAVPASGPLLPARSLANNQNNVGCSYILALEDIRCLGSLMICCLRIILATQSLGFLALVLAHSVERILHIWGMRLSVAWAMHN